MSAAVDIFNYRLPYHTIIGGIAAFSKEHFKLVNGSSNCFFQWGGEDDDLYNRLKYHGLRLKPYPSRISRYRMIRHLKENPNNDRYSYLCFMGFWTELPIGCNSQMYHLSLTFGLGDHQ